MRGSHYDVTRHWLIIDGKSTKDFDVFLSGDGTFKAAEKQLDEFTIPGRNGTFHYKSNTFKNVIVPYDCFIYRHFKDNVAAFRNFLLSKDGYVRIEDTHHPDEFRLGMFHNEFEPEVFVDLTAAQFTLEFDCKPERWLKSGEEFKYFEKGTSSIRNPYYFASKPIIRCYGATEGSVSIGGVTVTVTGVDAKNYVDIDCEEQEVHYGNDYTFNQRTTLVNGKFPTIKPGVNSVVVTGFVGASIKPRWWIL